MISDCFYFLVLTAVRVGGWVGGFGTISRHASSWVGHLLIKAIKQILLNYDRWGEIRKWVGGWVRHDLTVVRFQRIKNSHL